MTRIKPLLVTIANETWAMNNHLLRWLRYARRNSGCRVGLILISDNEQLKEELGEEFDVVAEFDMSHDHRDFYNTVRLEAPNLFDEPCIYCDCDADVIEDISYLLDNARDHRAPSIQAVASPGNHEDWNRIGDGKCYNNGFLVLNQIQDEAIDTAHLYENWLDIAKESCHPRTVGMMAFNLLVHSEQVSFAELPYSTSVVWWDDMAMRDAKVIQWCNDRGQAKRLMLEEEWFRGEEAL